MNIAFLAVPLALVACLTAQAQDTRNFLLGSPVAPAPSQRGIAVGADTRWVNVNQGEEIRFDAGGTTFAWKFDGPGARSFDLQQVAPAGALTRPVTVYVTPPPGHKP